MGLAFMALVKRVMNAAESREYRIRQTASEEQSEAAGTQKMADQQHGKAVVLDGGSGFVQHPQSFFRIRLFGADSAAQSIEPLHGVQIVAMEADAAHAGNGFTLLRENADDQIVVHGGDLRFQTVGGQNQPCAVLHPVGFRSGHGKLVAKVRGKIQK